MKQQKRPDWFPEGLWVLTCMALTMLMLWPLTVWVIQPGAKLLAFLFGGWAVAGVFVIGFGMMAIGGFLNWQKGLLPYQRRRQETLSRRIER